MRTYRSVLLKNVLPYCGIDGQLERTDIRVHDGFARFASACRFDSPPELEIDCGQFSCAQGFVDLWTEGGEPGFEDKEDFESLGYAALHSGFTTVCVSPDTLPVNDSRSVTEWIHRRAELAAAVEVVPIAAATRGLAGEKLADLFDLKEAGVGGVQFARGSIQDSGLMRRAYEYAKGLGLTVFERPLDIGLHKGGLMHEGRWSTEAGVKGSPRAAEDVSVARAIALADLVNSPIHIGPLSSARSVEMVRRAKADGLPVTASVNVLNLCTTSKAVRDSLHPSLNVVPPLRDEVDRKALLRGVLDGTIDAISSGHSSQTSADKQRPFEWSTPGACTLPMTLPMLLTLVEDDSLSIESLIRCLVQGSRTILGRRVERLSEESRSLVLFSQKAMWQEPSDGLGSKGRNVPIQSHALVGRVIATLSKGIFHVIETGVR